MRHDPIDPARFDVVERAGRPWPEPVPRVADRMVRPVLTVGPDDRVATAWQLMRTRGIRHLPVVDADKRLLGIVTDRDLRQVVPTLRVREVMTWGAVTVEPDAELRQAARLMHDRKIGALPVVADRRVVGILTETDLVRAFVDLLGEKPLRIVGGRAS